MRTGRRGAKSSSCISYQQVYRDHSTFNKLDQPTPPVKCHLPFLQTQRRCSPDYKVCSAQCTRLRPIPPYQTFKFNHPVQSSRRPDLIDQKPNMQPTKLLKALLVLLTTVFLVTLAHAESEESTHDLSEGNTFVSADQDASMAEPGNDYAMSCGGHKETTFECQRDPYKYYCNKQGKLKYSKRDTTICDWW